MLFFLYFFHRLSFLSMILCTHDSIKQLTCVELKWRINIFRLYQLLYTSYFIDIILWWFGGSWFPLEHYWFINKKFTNFVKSKRHIFLRMLVQWLPLLLFRFCFDLCDSKYAFTPSPWYVWVSQGIFVVTAGIYRISANNKNTLSFCE